MRAFVEIVFDDGQTMTAESEVPHDRLHLTFAQIMRMNPLVKQITFMHKLTYVKGMFDNGYAR